MADTYHLTTVVGPGNYQTWSAFAAAQAGDISGIPGGVILLVHDDWAGGYAQTAKIDLAAEGWITSATNRLIIRGNPGERHEGRVDNGARFSGGPYNEEMFWCNQVHVTFDYFAIDCANSLGTGISGFQVETSNCVLYHSGAAGETFNLLLNAKTARNTLFVTANGSGGTAWSPEFGSSGAALDNCGVAGAWANGFAASNNTPIYTNCWAFGVGGNGFVGNKAGTFNAADDGTAPPTSVITQALTSGDFVDEPNDYYNIDATSVLYQAGADLSGDFTDSINEVTRVAPFDAGPFASGSVVTVPDVTSVGGDNVILEGETGVAIVGTGFEFPNTTGTVILSDNSTFGAGNEVTQTVTNWASDTLVEFTANFTGTTVAEGGTAYVFVTNNSGETNLTTAGSTITRQDATSPNLTGATVTNVTDTGAQGNVTTNEANGTLFGVVSTSSSVPSPTQIQAGQDGTGTTTNVDWSGNKAVSASGAPFQIASGLTVGTPYYFYQQHQDAALNDSNVTSVLFATTSPGVLTSTLLDNADSPVINETAMNVYILSTTDGSLVHTFTAQTTDGSGVWTNSDSSIVTGTTYHIVASGVTDAGIEQTVTAT
jgi:hypothetical protein